MRVDCGYLCYTDEFKDGYLCRVKWCVALLKRDKSTACFFLDKETETGEYILENYDFLREVFGNSDVQLKKNDSYLSFQVTPSLEYKMLLTKNKEIYDNVACLYDVITTGAEYVEINYSDDGYSAHFEGNRVVHIKYEEPYLIIEDNEFKLKLQAVNNYSSEIEGVFKLDQVVPRNRECKKLEYSMPIPNGPLFIRENHKNVIVVTPTEEFQSKIGTFEVSGDGLVIWSPSSEGSEGSEETTS